jgi:hypothetical protein
MECDKKSSLHSPGIHKSTRKMLRSGAIFSAILFAAKVMTANINVSAVDIAPKNERMS